MRLNRVPAMLAAIAALILPAAAVWADDALEDILERGSLKVGVSLFVPWTMRSESGNLFGSEIDVADKLAADMGVKPDYRVYDWDDIIPALEKGEIDVIIAGMAITPGRALRVNFSRPSSESGVSIATNTEMTRNVRGLDQLNSQDIVIATVGETLAADLAATLFDNADLRLFKTAEEAEAAVLDDIAHAYVAAPVETNYLALRNPGKVDLPLSKPLLTSTAAFAVRRGEQELLNFLNAWVTARSADKWLDATYSYWFESLDWTKVERD
jgi:polar amino acid transport system substrate-binding protein